MIRLRLMGSVELTYEDGTVARSVLAQPKRVALLSYLALAHPRGLHRRDNLLALFWPEKDNEHARNGLRQSLHFLRKSLGDQVIVSWGGEEVGIGWDHVSIDVLELEEALGTGDVNRALELYDGDLMDGFFLSGAPKFDHWLDGERSRLCHELWKCTKTAAETAAASGDLPKAVELAEAASRLCPLREASARMLMHLYEELGDRTSALQVFDRLRHGLDTEFEVEPDAETQALADAIRNRHAPTASVLVRGDRTAEQSAEASRGRGDLLSSVRETVPEPLEQAIMKASPGAAEDRFKTTRVTAASPATGGQPVRTRQRSIGSRLALYAVALLVLATVVAAGHRLWPGTPDFKRDIVVVVPFVNETGDPSLDGQAALATSWIAQGLQRTGLFQVVPHRQVSSSWTVQFEAARRDARFDSYRAIAEEFGAGTLIVGSMFSITDSLRLVLEIVDPEGLAVGQNPGPVVVLRDSLMQGLEILQKGVTAALARRLYTFLGENSVRWRPAPSLDVFQEMEAALRAYFEGDMERALRRARAASHIDSSFAPARVQEAIYLLNLGRLPEADSVLNVIEGLHADLNPTERTRFLWARATVRGDRPGAYRAAKEGEDLPDGIIYRWLHGVEALRMNLPEEALQVMSSVDRDSPFVRVSKEYWDYLAETLHVLGDHQRELREVRRGRSVHPDDALRRPQDPLLVQAEIRARAALGQTEHVRKLAEVAITEQLRPAQTLMIAALELRAHGHDEAYRAVGERSVSLLQSPVPRGTRDRVQLMKALYVLERWDEAYLIAKELTREAPSVIDHLGYLGTLAARRGDRENAVRVSEKIAAAEWPYDWGEATYRRARIAALLGEEEQAVSLLERASSQGMKFTVDLHIDMDLEPLRAYPRMKEFMRPKG